MFVCVCMYVCVCVCVSVFDCVRAVASFFLSVGGTTMFNLDISTSLVGVNKQCMLGSG